MNGVAATSSMGACVGLAHLGYSIVTASSPILIGTALAIVGVCTFLYEVGPEHFKRQRELAVPDLAGLSASALRLNLMVGGLASVTISALGFGAWMSRLSPWALGGSIFAAGGLGYILETRSGECLPAAACLAGVASVAFLLAAFPPLAHVIALLQAMLVAMQLGLLVVVAARGLLHSSAPLKGGSPALFIGGAVRG